MDLKTNGTLLQGNKNKSEDEAVELLRIEFSAYGLTLLLTTDGL